MEYMTSNMTSPFLREYELNLKVSPNPQTPDIPTIQVTHKEKLNFHNDMTDYSDPRQQLLKW